MEAADVEDVIIALSAEAHLPEQAEIDARDKDRIAAGTAIIQRRGALWPVATSFTTRARPTRPPI